MSYRPKTNFRNKDAMERGDPYKRVRGAELQDEFEAISRAVATQGSQIENIDNSVENIINNGGGGGGGTSGPVGWDDVTGKPATYPPEAHNHDGEYLKDFTEEDPTVPDHVKSISEADIDGWNAASSGTAPVTSVNTKTGAVVLDASDVGALPDTFAEEDPTVPDHVKSITQDDLDRWDVAAGIDVPVTSVNGMEGDVTLTADDVGALPDTYTPPAAPVDSVNGKTGAVTLSASDVGALPDSTTIPPAAPVDSVNGKTGAVVLSASDVGALPDTYTPPDAGDPDWAKVDNKGTAIGFQANAESQGSAYGQDAVATGQGAIAIGRGSRSEYEDGIAIGEDSTSNGRYGIALGYQAQAEEYQFKICDLIDVVQFGDAELRVRAVSAEEYLDADGNPIGGGGGGGMQYEIDQPFKIIQKDSLNSDMPPTALTVYQGHFTYHTDRACMELQSQESPSIMFNKVDSSKNSVCNSVLGFNGTSTEQYYTFTKDDPSTSNGGNVSLGGTPSPSSHYKWLTNVRITGTYTGTTSFTSRSFQNGAPVIDARELISVLSDLRDVTKDAAVTSVDSLKTAMSSKLDSLVDRLTRGIDESRAVDEDAWAYTTMSEDDYNEFMREKYGEPEE